MNYKKFLGTASAALMIVIVTLMLAPGAWGQSKFKTLYKFKGGKDGNSPQAGLVFDQAGNLYGTTVFDRAYPHGTVFELTPNPDGSWKESVLYTFTGGNDGRKPYAGLIFDQAGNLYGTTSGAGTYGHGVVFKLTPKSDGSWTESVLYSFTGGNDGFAPFAGLIFDRAGNLYGTTFGGGIFNCGGGGCGVVFKLTPNADGSWTESVLHSFLASDGTYPEAGLIFDAAGNLYGTTISGGADNGGTVFKLTPKSDGSWTESVLYSFTGGNDGRESRAGVIFDQAGSLYGTTQLGGSGVGVVFKLTPNANGGWTEKVLHQFTGGKDGAGPVAGVIFDQAGSLYGTTTEGGNLNCGSGRGCGVVFKLTPNSNGGWTESVLHAFIDRAGAFPWAGVIFDAAGNLYGTTYGDRLSGTPPGSVFEITP